VTISSNSEGLIERSTSSVSSKYRTAVFPPKWKIGRINSYALWAGSKGIPARYPKYITGTYRRTVRAHTVLDCFKAYNTRYAVKYTVFARILVLYRPINLTNPIRQLYTSGYSVYSCLIGIVDLMGGHSAMNLAKSLIVSKKLFQWSRTYAVKWEFLAENLTFRKAWSIRYTRSKHAVHSYLRNRTTAHSEYLMGYTVNNMLKLWVYVNSLSLRDTYRFKKENNETARTFAVKQNIWYNVVQARLTNQTLSTWRMIPTPD
jgi:hypothetical protein